MKLQASANASKPPRTDARDVEIDEAVRGALTVSGYVVFDGEVVRMTDDRRAQLRNLRDEFDRLDFQTPANDDSDHFFDARRIAVGHIDFGPGDCEQPEVAGGFIAALAAATVRVLPDYAAGRSYSIAWMLARHASSVDAMPVHRDEVDWLAEFNVARSSGAFGGAVQIIDASEHVVAEQVLERPLDGYIVRDADFRHGVTAMRLGSADDHRDVLIVRVRAR